MAHRVRGLFLCLHQQGTMLKANGFQLCWHHFFISPPSQHRCNMCWVVSAINQQWGALPVPAPEPGNWELHLQRCHFSQPPAPWLWYRSSIQPVGSYAGAWHLQTLSALQLLPSSPSQAAVWVQLPDSGLGPGSFQFCPAVVR